MLQRKTFEIARTRKLRQRIALQACQKQRAVYFVQPFLAGYFFFFFLKIKYLFIMFLHNTKAHFSFIVHSASWGLVQSAVPHNVQLHTPDSSQETKPKPVPPATIATCLNLRTFGSDFLSGRMAN